VSGLTGEHDVEEVQELFEQEQGAQEKFFKKMLLTSLLFKGSWNLLDLLLSCRN
jgi:hypothetical protein